MKVNYTQFKDFATQRGTDILMVEFEDKYNIFTTEDNLSLECTVVKETSDATDFEANLLDLCNPVKEEQSRFLICKSGRTICDVIAQITTSKIASVPQYFSLKFYDDEDTELLTQQDIDAGCVKTKLSFCPTYDYEIMAGKVWQKSVPATSIKLNCYVAPQIAANSGGSITVVDNLDLSFIDKEYVIDGRSPKDLVYTQDDYTNEILIKLTHGVGVQHDLQIAVELFK